MTRNEAASSNATSPAWTKEEDDRLRACFRAQFSVPAICASFPDRSARGIQHRAKRLGFVMTVTQPTAPSAMPQGLDAEISRLCTYIRDDSNIAAYLGTPIDRVRGIREAAVAKRDERLSLIKQEAPIGFDAYAADSIVRGSAALRDKLIAYFERQAKRHRCPVSFVQDHLNFGPTVALANHLEKALADV